MHPRNRDREGYDFPRLTESSPELRRFVVRHPIEGATIDFADPAAVMALNRALLKTLGVNFWSIPDGYLCPGIPGRADYIHSAADLLGEDFSVQIPIGPKVQVLDIGVGANCVYPLIGSLEYGWSFVGTEIDRVALASAQAIVAGNSGLKIEIDCRLQPDPQQMFSNVIQRKEKFALSICNPPFHASKLAASAGTSRKVRNLGSGQRASAVLNFGGQSNELWCQGGEPAFVRRLIRESADWPELCSWFSVLVSKSSSLPTIDRALHAAGVRESRIIAMTQGQKKSRVVAWTFLTKPDRAKRLA